MKSESRVLGSSNMQEALLVGFMSMVAWTLLLYVGYRERSRIKRGTQLGIKAFRGVFVDNETKLALIDRTKVAVSKRRWADMIKKYEVQFPSPTPISRSNESLLVVVPFFNNFEIARELLEDILEMKSGASKLWQHLEILVSDDASEPHESVKMRTFCREFGLTYTRNKANLGFLGNANQSYLRGHGCSHVLFLNSDVRLPTDFFARLAQHGANPDNALVTVPSFEDFVSWGARATTWFEFDEQILPNSGVTMAACTAIGYCLLVNTELVSSPLFDSAFGHGYGEDSDLHMRVDSDGKRSVIALDMCVYHAGGVSYGQGEQADEHRTQGAQLFLEKWRAPYAREFPLFVRSISAYLSNLDEPAVGEGDVWILTPAISNSAIGGLSVLEELASGLSRKRAKVRIVPLVGPRVLAPVIRGGVTPISSRLLRTVAGTSEKRRVQKSKPLLVLGGVAGVKHYKELSEALKRKFRLGLVLQGPDFLMEPGSVGDFRELIELAEVVFVNSEYMRQTAELFGAKRTLQFHPELGIKKPASTPLPEERNWDLIVCNRPEPGKAAWLSRAVANYFSDAGWRVASFGAGDVHDSDSYAALGVLSPGTLQKEFLDSRVYFDSSIYEGYGLSPREALMCGSNVVAVQNGGNRELLGKPGFEAVEPWDFAGIVEAVRRAHSLESHHEALERGGVITLSDAVHSVLKEEDSI
jgi:GT2 family glycosyltransferase